MIDTKQPYNKPLYIVAQIQCFTLGDVNFCAYDSERTTLAMLNHTNTLFLFNLSIIQSISNKIQPFYQIQLTISQEIVKIGLIKTDENKFVLITQTNNKNIKIWCIAKNLSIIDEIVAVDFIVDSQSIIIIKKCEKYEQNKVQEIQQYSVFRYHCLHQKTSNTQQIIELLDLQDIQDNNGHTNVRKQQICTISSQKTPYFINKMLICQKNIYKLHQKSLVQIHMGQFRVQVDNMDIKSINHNQHMLMIATQSQICIYNKDHNTQVVQLNDLIKNAQQQLDHAKLNISISKVSQKLISILIIAKKIRLYLIKPAIVTDGANNSKKHNQYQLITSKQFVDRINPLIFSNTSHDTCIHLFDNQNHNILMIQPSAFLKLSHLANKFISIKNKSDSCWAQQPNITMQTVKNMKMRISSLQNLQTYIQKYDILAGFRFLQNTNNIAVLNDGLTFIANKKLTNLHLNCASPGQTLHWSYYHTFFNLTNKLFESKYESHIQNSLKYFILLIRIISDLSINKITQSERRQNKKLIQKYQKIIDSKRINKLLNQEKKVKLFQLSYELKTLVNSYGKITR